MEQRRSITPADDRTYTEAEYLRLEEAASTRHEFRNGRIIAIAGGTHEHGIIAMNLGSELRNRLRDKPCLTAGSDVRVRVNKTGHYAYPDLSVVCADPIYLPGVKHTTLLNPQLVVEVLSASTMSNGLGAKFDDYARIESLQEYVVIAQDRAWARSFIRTPEGRWTIVTSVDGLDAVLSFPSIGVEVPLSEVYLKVSLLPSPPKEVPPEPS